QEFASLAASPGSGPEPNGGSLHETDPKRARKKLCQIIRKVTHFVLPCSSRDCINVLYGPIQGGAGERLHLIFPPPKSGLNKFLPIVLFRRLRRILNHNSFSHKRLEQNETSFPHANFGFWV